MQLGPFLASAFGDDDSLRNGIAFAIACTLLHSYREFTQPDEVQAVMRMASEESPEAFMSSMERPITPDIAYPRSSTRGVAQGGVAYPRHGRQGCRDQAVGDQLGQGVFRCWFHVNRQAGPFQHR